VNQTNRLIVEDVLRVCRAFGYDPFSRKPVEIPDFLAFKREVAQPVEFLPLEDGMWRYHDLLQMVVEAAGISRSQIVSERRSREYVQPRQTFCWIAKRFSVASLPQIGRLLGGRDHTTVLHAVRRVDALVAAVGNADADTPQAWIAFLLGQPWPAVARETAHV
jgi:hypothetical protein